MFKITIERKYKFKYTIYRNRREIISFHSKKLARDQLFQLKKDFEQLNKSQNIFNIYPLILRSGDCLVVYTSKRQTLGDPIAEDFKDYFEIKREFNENY
ncbi:MAG: hypothetical protein WAV68_01120 [Candidatus Nanogingivalis sp.]